ncbi:MAG: hypothetical protein JOZ03_05485 [Gammaproteobacteria bacterium]|nr:hypothetical protein [Gammaproteobacteria bacterium]
MSECDPAGYVRCIHQAAFASIPIVDAGVYLTYSSEWQNGSGRPWDAAALGLGGWAVNFLQRYDAGNHVLLSGDGSWRVADPVPLAEGGFAVPSYDGSLAYLFDSAGRHVRTVDGRLGMTLLVITYDAAGRIASMQGSMGGRPVHMSVERDAQGRARQLLGSDQMKTELTLDGNGRLVRTLDSAGDATSIEWLSSGIVSAKTDPLGHTAHYGYDASGRLQTATDEDGVTVRFERRELTNGFEVTVTSALGRRSAYRAERSSEGLRLTATATDGSTNTEYLDARGARHIQWADGTRSSVGSLAHPTWGTAAPILTPSTATRPDGVQSLREVRFAVRADQGLPYRLSGTIETIENGHRWVETLDPTQRTRVIVDGAGRRTLSAYDSAGRIVRSLHPGIAEEGYGYDSMGRLASVTVGSGPESSTTRYDYDAPSGSVTVTLPDGTVAKTLNDRAGRPAASVDASGAVTLMTHDRAGRLVGFQAPGGFSYRLGLSAAGRFTGFAPPMIGEDGTAEILSYDADGRLQAIAGPGAISLTAAYDSGARLTSVQFDQGRRDYRYAPQSDRVEEIQDPGGVVTAYRYAGPYATRIAWSGAIAGAVELKRDADGRITHETVNGGSALDYAYDPAGLLSGIGSLSIHRDESGLIASTHLGLVDTQYRYDGQRRLVRSRTTVGKSALFEQSYDRDARGRITRVTELGPGTRSTKTEYAYDPAGRLREVRIDGRLVEHNEYDAAGNRLRSDGPKGQLSARYDARDRLIEWGSARYAWASSGKLLKWHGARGDIALSYDDLGALREAGLPNGRKLTFLVDGEGHRVGRRIDDKLDSGLLYRPDGTLAAEMDGAGQIRSRFGFDDRGDLALLQRGSATYRVLTDALGSPRLLVDSSTGAVVAEVAYDAWGNVVRESNSDFLPVGFAGGLREPETGLLRFGARDYDPQTGRWTAPDPILIRGGDANLYAYVHGDPVNATDRAGLFWNQINPWAPYEPPPGGAPPGGAPPGGAPPGSAPPGSAPPPSNGQPPPNGQQPPNNAPPPPLPPSGGSPPPGNQAPQGGCIGFICLPPSGGGGCVFGFCGGPPGGFRCTAMLCSPYGGPPCIICSYGDPHYVALGGVDLAFQAVGEFVALRSSDGKLVLELRQEPVAHRRASFISAVAIGAAGDRISVYQNEPSYLLVNDREVTAADIEEQLPHGSRLSRHGGSVRVDFPDGGRMTITRTGVLNVGYLPPPGTMPHLQGLLASNTGNRFTAPDGTVLSRSDLDFELQFQRHIGEAGRVKPAESLFHYWPGESTAKFTNIGFPGTADTAATLSPSEHAHGERVCRAFGVDRQPLLDDCILDVGATGQPAIAAASAAIASSHSPMLALSTSAITAGSEGFESNNGFAIRIGDSVSPGRPAAEAGMIGPQGGKQAYSFVGTQNAHVYLSATDCTGSAIRIDLQDPTGQSLGGRLGCGDVGPVALPRDATYRVVIRAEQAAHYGFSLSAAPFDRFEVGIGATVAPDHPPGAGLIRAPGARQLFGFHADAGARVYVKVGPCEGEGVVFDLEDPSAHSLAGKIGCGDFGPVTLATAGTYQLQVRSDKPPNRYTFSLLPAHVQRYAITVGDTVSPDHPASGAGVLSEIGQEQWYEFSGHAGEIVYLSSGGCDSGRTYLKLVNPDGTTLASNGGNCSVDAGRAVLPIAGRYHIVASRDASSVRSGYRFALIEVPGDRHFAVHLPFVASKDSPSSGAGLIPGPGAQHFYDFDAHPGSVVHLEGNCSCTGLRVRVVKAGDTGDLGYSELHSQDWTLPEGGHYTVQVASFGYTGSYTLRVALASKP